MPTRSDEPDYDRLWAEIEEKREKQEQARRRVWVDWVKQNDRRAPYSPWLIIPSDLSDYGQRPLPPKTPFYASPFISVESPDPSGRPLAGAKNFLLAKVFNLGAASAAPTKVDFFWADPSVGLGPSDFTLIGTEWVEVQPLSSTVVKCKTPWIPTYLNNGHECVMVNCDNHILDPILAPFQPWSDRHVGQRNLAVLPAIAQKFFLWAPLGLTNAPAEIRVLALHGVAPNGFRQYQTAYDTLNQATYEVLLGIKGISNGMEPNVFAERIAPTQVIRDVRSLDEARLIGKRESTRQIRQEDLANFLEVGDLVLQLATGPGTAVHLELDLHQVDLASNEIIVLNVSHVCMGTVTGGYTLTLVAPEWLRDSLLNIRRGDFMQKRERQNLEQLVIQHNAESRITYQLASQMEELLPIRSLQEVMERLREGVVVDDQRLQIEMLASYIPEELFPIEDTQDLVVKMSAATRVALATLAKGSSTIVEQASVREILTTGLSLSPGNRTPIPSGHFTGPSIYGSTVA